MTNLPMVCPRESDDQTSNRERERESSALSSSSENRLARLLLVHTTPTNSKD